MLAILRGAPDAEEQALRALEIGVNGGQPDANAAFGAQLSQMRSQQGRYAEIGDAMIANVNSAPHIASWRAALALMYCETDRLTQARTELDRFVSNNFDLPPDWSWTATMYNLSEVTDWLRDTNAAAVLYARLKPVAHQVGTLAGFLLCYGSLGYCAGLLAACLQRWDEASHHFEQALTMNERLGARPWNVRTRRAYASMLLDRKVPGDRERAAELIAAGRAEAETLGMARELLRFERLCTKAGC